MRRKDIFYLAGFMASGKSTIGPMVANTLGWNFIDLDKEIEKRENRKITKIFEEEGEDYFRRKETEILKEISEGKNLIISLGGGTLIIQENRKFIKKSGNLICLSSSPEFSFSNKCRIEVSIGLLKHPTNSPVEVNLNLEHVEQKGALSLAIMPNTPPKTLKRSDVESPSADSLA